MCHAKIFNRVGLLLVSILCCYWDQRQNHEIVSITNKHGIQKKINETPLRLISSIPPIIMPGPINQCHWHSHVVIRK